MISNKMKQKMNDYARRLKNCKEQNLRLIKENKKVMNSKIKELLDYIEKELDTVKIYQYKIRYITDTEWQRIKFRKV